MGNEKTLLAFSKAQLPGNKSWWRLRAWPMIHTVGEWETPRGGPWLGGFAARLGSAASGELCSHHTEAEGPWSLWAGTPDLHLPRFFSSPPLLPSLGSFCVLSWQQSTFFFSEHAWRVFILYPNIWRYSRDLHLLISNLISLLSHLYIYSYILYMTWILLYLLKHVLWQNMAYLGKILCMHLKRMCIPLLLGGVFYICWLGQSSW